MKLNLALVATALFSQMAAAVPAADESRVSHPPKNLYRSGFLAEALSKRDQVSKEQTWQNLNQLQNALKGFVTSDSFQYGSFGDQIVEISKWVEQVRSEAHMLEKQGVDVMYRLEDIERMYKPMLRTTEFISEYETCDYGFDLVKRIMVLNVEISAMPFVDYVDPPERVIATLKQEVSELKREYEGTQQMARDFREEFVAEVEAADDGLRWLTENPPRRARNGNQCEPLY